MENLIKESILIKIKLEIVHGDINMRREKLFIDQWSFHNKKFQQTKVISNMTLEKPHKML
jgi:hypothetical protein